MQNLKGKVALITGGSSGIGKAIATSLAKEGCKLSIVALGQEDIDKTVAEISQAHGVTIKGYDVNLLDNAALRESFKATEQDLGPIDILVNNAGLGTFKPMDEMTEREAEMPVQLPFGAAVVGSHIVIPGMLKRGSGHIVNLTSPSGFMPLPYMMPYTASRHAMVGLSDALYEELHPTGIGVSLLCPSQVNTGYFDRNDADMKWWPKFSSLFPTLEPEAVGEKAVFAIKNDKREVIFPATLKIAMGVFRKMPRATIALCRLLGLWGPARSR